MTRGFRPAERLDPAVIADALSSSVTPVRDALNLLTGEGLVTTRTGDGFHLPSIDQPGLTDLYMWNAEVLGLALAAWPKTGPEELLATEGARTDIAYQTAALFNRIAARSINLEHRRAITSLNARLNAVRMIEPIVIEAPADELIAIEAALLAMDAASLRRTIASYHRARRRRAADIVRALYREALPPSPTTIAE